MRFKVGDRVKCTCEYEDNTDIVGNLGKILAVRSRKGDVLVEFDCPIDGHDGDNSEGRDGHCWYITEDCLILIKRKTERKKVFGIVKFTKKYYV